MRMRIVLRKVSKKEFEKVFAKVRRMLRGLKSAAMATNPHQPAKVIGHARVKFVVTATGLVQKVLRATANVGRKCGGQISPVQISLGRKVCAKEFGRLAAEKMPS